MKSLLLIRRWQVAKPTLEILGKDYSPFEAYFARQKPLVDRQQIPFLMLSILDSGPGFAQRWTRKPLASLSLAQEEEAVANCFGFNTTKGHERFGQGLPLVRSLLREREGFLRLRTGRLSLYYDAGKDDRAEISDVPLSSWSLGSQTTLAPAGGSLLTILLPIGRTQ